MSIELKTKKCEHNYIRYEGDLDTLEGKVPSYCCIPPPQVRARSQWCGNVMTPFPYGGELDVDGSYKTYCYAAEDSKSPVKTYYIHDPHESMNPVRGPC